jgi:ArsR family transcriptional regulator, cadmium/lead-responsive transcriptional repressor
VTRSATAGAIFGALADDTRRDVLSAVAQAQGATATELAERLPITRQAVAKHLAVLRGAGLVTAEQDGREVRYRVVPGSLRPAGDWIDSTETQWQRRLARLRQQVRSR